MLSFFFPKWVVQVETHWYFSRVLKKTRPVDVNRQIWSVRVRGIFCSAKGRTTLSTVLTAFKKRLKRGIFVLRKAAVLLDKSLSSPLVLVWKKPPGAGHCWFAFLHYPAAPGERQCPWAGKHPPTHSSRSSLSSCWLLQLSAHLLPSKCVIFPFSVKDIPRRTLPGQWCICHIYHASCSTVAPWAMLAQLFICAVDYLVSTKMGRACNLLLSG